MRKLLLSLLVVSLSVAYAEPPEITETDQRIINLLFSGSWQAADSLIDLEITRLPDQPKYYFFKAYNLFYSRIFARNPMTRDRIIESVKHYTWEAITRGERLPETAETRFYVGNSYAFLCRANIMRQEYWLAYWNARKCRSYLEDVVEEEPAVDDAYFGLAVLDYYPAVAVTGFRKALAWIGGMSGDRGEGLRNFQRVAEKGMLFQDEALFALTIVYRFGENNIDSALSCWKALAEKYPGNSSFSNGYRQMALTSEIMKRGAQFLEDEIATIRQSYGIAQPFLLNTIGYNLESQGRHEDAFIVFTVNIKLFPDVSNGYDSLGEWYLNQNNFEKSRYYYGLASERLPADTSLTPEGREALRNNINQKLRELEGK